MGYVPHRQAFLTLASLSLTWRAVQVLVYLIRLADRCGVDLAAAVARKLQKCELAAYAARTCR